MIYKAIIFIALGLNVFLNHGIWLHETCNIDIAKLAIPPVIWYEQSIDGSAQPHLVTRILHNKPGVFLNQLGKCYFQNIEPYLLYKTVGLVGMVSVFYLFYKAIDSRKYILLSLLTLVPIFPIVGSNTAIQILIYKLLALVGLILFLKNIHVKK